MHDRRDVRGGDERRVVADGGRHVATAQLVPTPPGSTDMSGGRGEHLVPSFACKLCNELYLYTQARLPERARRNPACIARTAHEQARPDGRGGGVGFARHKAAGEGCFMTRSLRVAPRRSKTTVARQTFSPDPPSPATTSRVTSSYKPASSPSTRSSRLRQPRPHPTGTSRQQRQTPRVGGARARRRLGPLSRHVLGGTVRALRARRGCMLARRGHGRRGP